MGYSEYSHGVLGVLTQLLEEALERSLREMIAEQRKAASLSCT